MKKNYYQNENDGDNLKTKADSSPIGEIQSPFRRFAVARATTLQQVQPATQNLKESPLDAVLGSTSDIPSPQWALKKGKNMPLHYNLENPVTINESVQETAARLADCFYERSLDSNHKDGEAEAKCRTFCNTVFMVRLFEGKELETTVLEVQRLSGCCVQLRHERNAIVKAAKEGVTAMEKTRRNTIPDFLLKLVEPPTLEETKLSMKQLVNELTKTSSSRESQSIQLDLLSSMTDREKSNAENCDKIAKMILEENIFQIRSICFNMLDSGASDEISKSIRTRILLTFANCLECLQSNKTLSGVLESDNFFSQEFYPNLVKELEKCKCPHSAFLISKCLTHLLKNSTSLRGDGQQELFKRTVAWGQTSHKKLYTEATAATRVLDL